MPKNLMSKKVINISLIGLLTVASVGSLAVITEGFRNWNIFNQVFKPETDTSIKDNGISVKLVNTLTNPDGSITKSFSFSVEPVGADDQSVTASASFLDGTNCNAHIGILVDNTSKMISATTKSVGGRYGWDKPIIITVVSNDNNEAYATVKLEYVKKIESMNLSDQGNGYFKIGPGMNPSNDNYGHFITGFGFDQILNVDYSVYTVDKTYSFKSKDVSVSYREDNFPSEVSSEEYQAFDRASAALCELLALRIQNGEDYFTADEIWSLDETNEWHSFLKNHSTYDESTGEEGWMSFDYAATYYCTEDITKELKVTEGIITMSFDFGFDSEKYSVGVSSVELESAVIEF